MPKFPLFLLDHRGATFRHASWVRRRHVVARLLEMAAAQFRSCPPHALSNHDAGMASKFLRRKQAVAMQSGKALVHAVQTNVLRAAH